MSIATIVNEYLTRDNMAEIATQSGSNLDANLVPRDVRYLSEVLTSHVLKHLSTITEYADKVDELRPDVSACVTIRIKSECKFSHGDLFSHDDSDVSVGELLSRFFTWIKS